MHACAQLDTFHSEMESLELTAREEATTHQPRGARYAGPDDVRDMSKAHTFLLTNQVKLGGITWASAVSGDGVEPKLTYVIGSG